MKRDADDKHGAAVIVHAKETHNISNFPRVDATPGKYVMFKLWAVQWSSENSFIAHELDAMEATKFQATAAIIASRQGSSSSSYRLGSGITL